MNEQPLEASPIMDAATLPGVPDAFQRLWTPHRIAYIQGESAPEDGSCVFCVAPDMSDDDSLVVARGVHVYAVLNLFPYNAGHLLICPYRHVANYDEITPAELKEMGEFVQIAMKVLRTTTRSHGFNIGINQGKVAGAGIEEHLHQHVVPRWGQDSNFFPIIAQTRAMPQLLGQTRDLLRESWPSGSSG
jgi:ATP adenylyltransferase